jgi:tetratricopeptide (TPR) repeat protein
VKVLSSLARRVRGYYDWFSTWGCLPVDEWIEASRFYKAGDYAKAAELYKLGLKSNPNSPARANALLDLAHCLFRIRAHQEAEIYLRQVVSVHPDLREGYVRLARLQLWLGYANEALWTMRVCVSRIALDPELLTLFITAVVEAGGQPAAIAEARALLAKLHYEPEGFPRLEVARARLNFLSDSSTESRLELSKLAALDRGPFEAVVAFAEVLISEGKIAYARHHLHRALTAAPDHPRVLRLLALTYLTEGLFYEPEHAVQVALRGCQVTGWRGIHETFILAQAYMAAGDKVAALLAATRAKQIAARLIGGFPEVEQLEKMLHGATAESQA